MKKIVLILTIVLGINMLSVAQGSIFKRGSDSEGSNTSGMPLVPKAHNQHGAPDADAPLGEGVLFLMGLGVGYALRTKKKDQ